MDEMNPVSAVTSSNPSAFYRTLAIERPVYRDEHLAAWIVSGNEAVSATLTDRSMRVRPAKEAVPKAMAGTSIGDVFGRLVRFTDDENGAVVKAAIRSSLASIDRETVAAVVSRTFRILSNDCKSVAKLIDDGTVLPSITPFVTASLLGFADDECKRIARLARPIAKALGPGADLETIAGAIPATDELRTLIGQHMERSRGVDRSLEFVAEAEAAGVDREDVIANVVGLFFQGYDANAGLIGIVLHEIVRSEADLAKARSDSNFLASYVRSVARRIPAIQNTRRFSSTDRAFLGCPVRAGDALLLILASGTGENGPREHEYLLEGEDAMVGSLTFGMGRHMCPGSKLAGDIASSVVRRLIELGLQSQQLVLDGYEPSFNARIPRLSFRRAPEEPTLDGTISEDATQTVIGQRKLDSELFGDTVRGPCIRP